MGTSHSSSRATARAVPSSFRIRSTNAMEGSYSLPTTAPIRIVRSCAEMRRQSSCDETKANPVTRISKVNFKKCFPPPRSGYFCTYSEDGRYAFIGFGRMRKRNKLLNDIWQLDLKNYQWTELVHKCDIAPREGAAAAVSDGSLFLFGGRNHHSYFNDLYKIDLTTQVVATLKTTDAPEPRSNPMFGYHDHQLFVWGGEVKFGKSKDMYVLSLNSSKWGCIHTDINVCAQSQSVANQGILCAYGGEKAGSFFMLDMRDKTVRQEISPYVVENRRNSWRSTCCFGDVVVCYSGRPGNAMDTVYGYHIRRNYWFDVDFQNEDMRMADDQLLSGSSAVLFSERNREIIVLAVNSRNPDIGYRISVACAMAELNLSDDMNDMMKLEMYLCAHDDI